MRAVTGDGVPGVPQVPWSLRDVGLAIITVVGGLVVSVIALGLVYSVRDGNPTTGDTLFVAAVLSALMAASAWRYGAGKYRVGWRALGLVPHSGHEAETDTCHPGGGEATGSTGAGVTGLPSGNDKGSASPGRLHPWF